MKMTRHASMRQQQRGIPPIVIDLLIDYGCVERAGSGTTTHYFNKDARRRLRAYVGQMSSQIERYLDYYVILSDDGSVITVAPRNKKVNH